MVPAAEAKPTIANYLSLYTAAALAVWMPEHVFVRACVYVHARCSGVGEGEGGKEGGRQIVGFSLQREKRRNVEREGRREGERETGRNMQSGYNRKQRGD